jgi:hypothetical protein
MTVCHDPGFTSERRKARALAIGLTMGPTLAIVGILLVGDALGTPAQAETPSAQWCAYFTGGPTNCGFSTFEECLQAIKGKTGLCSQTPQDAPSSGDQSAPAHHHHHHLHRTHQRPKKSAAHPTDKIDETDKIEVEP